LSTRRDLIYRMTADPEGFKKGMREAGKDSRQFYKELRALEEQQKAVDEVMTGGGLVMAGYGAAVAAGLGVSAKAAIEWESAWTGVLKVVDGSPEQMAALEGELRNLATTLPQTHAEIAGVAAAAGQLGIAREDIAQFTETVVAMGVSTDLASEDAAMGMARLMNIMQSAPDQVDNLGSAIVGLGNAGASTESEIVEMALRIAGAGHTVGMTEAEVLAFSSALASVGIEAESGGSSISTAMIKISEAVNEGGDALDTFAQVAGVTADEFAAKFRSDPAAAIDSFVQGLGRIQSSGGDVFATLEELGLSEIRLRDALLRLAGAGDLLTESLATGNEAWNENTALMAEAERRYGTTEAQIAIAKNQLVDLGITLGETLLPAINGFLDVADGLFLWFQSAPAWLKQTVVWLGFTTAAIALVGGAALVAVPKVHALNVALGEIGTKGALRTQRALSGVTGFLLGPWGVALGGAITILGIFGAEQAKARAKTDDLSATFNDQTGAITENTRAWIANELQAQGAFDSAKDFGISQSELVDAVINGNDVLAEQKRYYDELRAASGETGDEFRQMTDEEWNQADAVDYLDGQITGLQGTYDAAAAAAENKRLAIQGDTAATNDASEATQLYAEQLGVSTDVALEAKEGIQELDAALQQITQTLFGVQEAEDAVAQIVNTATEQFAENGGAIAGNTEEALQNRETLRSLIAAYLDQVSAVAESTGSQAEAMQTAEELEAEFRSLAEQLGLSEEQIDQYARAFDEIPSLVETTVLTKYVQQNSVVKGPAVPGLADGGYVGFADGGPVQSFPGGGAVRGAGTARSDSIDARLSNGEFVINAAATAKNRALLEAINAGRRVTSAVNIDASTAGVNQTFNVSLNTLNRVPSTDEVLDGLRYKGLV
jgi:TP901 family phage tail tape measure protein